ncbi:MAG: mycothiol transferase [Actinomycetes bacterium]
MPGHAFPVDHPGAEKELLLDWLGFLRDAVVRKASVEDRQAHWRPECRLLTLVGIVNHLTHVEWRWIDGGFLGMPIDRSEAEFHPGDELAIAVALDAYEQRAAKTDALVRSTALDAQCRLTGEAPVSLRWVLLHLINETARHAGHADAVRELLDGMTGE